MEACLVVLCGKGTKMSGSSMSERRLEVPRPLPSKFIKGLISFHGLTILTSGVLMGFSIQFDNAAVSLDSFAYPNFVWCMRVVIFVATPVIPVVVILRALRLTTEAGG